MAESSIEWTDYTFNPWSGCTKVSEGCKHCYAEVNYSVKMRGVKWGPQGNRIVAAESMWKQPIAWNKKAIPDPTSSRRQLRPPERPRVFCASLADAFEDWTGPMLDHHNRPLMRSRFQEVFQDEPINMDFVRFELFNLIRRTPNLDWQLLTKRPENIKRIPLLLQTPVAVRFLSCEPLLGPVDLCRVEWPNKGGHRVRRRR